MGQWGMALGFPCSPSTLGFLRLDPRLVGTRPWPALHNPSCPLKDATLGGSV